MKLNFWQWLGLICIVVGVIGYVFLKDAGDPPRGATHPTASTQATP